MRFKQLEFGRKLKLLLVVWFSLSLSVPVIAGLGYSVPGFYGAAFFTVFVTSVYFLFSVFPILFLSIPLLILAAVILQYLFLPGLLSDIYFILLTPQPSDSLLWPLVAIAAISLFYYLLLLGVKKPLIPCLIVGIGSIIPLWYVYIDTAYPAAVAYAIGWMFLLSYESGSSLWSGLKSRTKEDENGLELRQHWLKYTVFTLIIALLVALLIPKSFSPLAPPALRAWARSTFPFIEGLRGAPEYGLRGDGSEFRFNYGVPETSARLGGPLRMDGTVLLEVGGRGGFHLRGTAYDQYSGWSWVNTFQPERLEEFSKPLPAISQYFTETEFWVRYNMLSTNTIFGLLYVEEIKGLPSVLWVDRNENLTQSRSLPLGLRYQLKGRAVKSWGDISALENDDYSLNMDTFLQLPDNLPARVIDLALEITGDVEGSYRKMRALEEYLRVNYSYNIDVPLLPADTDFVDYFLFTLEEGYCTSFASALAVMARAAGVPTRYVVGFMVPSESSGRGVYQVAGLNAHAWVEGFIPGVGWLTFEPTPGFTVEEILVEELIEGDTSAVGDISDAEDGESVAVISYDEYGISHFLSPGIIAITIVLLTLFFVAVLSLSRYRTIKKALYKLNLQPPAPRAVGYYSLVIALLEGMSAGKYPGETPAEFSRRVKHDQIYHMKMSFREISEGVSNTIYSRNKYAPVELAEQTELFFQYIYKLYLAKVGRLTAFWELIICRRYFVTTNIE